MPLGPFSKLPLWPVVAAVVLYLYWAYFYNREGFKDQEAVGGVVFAIKDGMWPNVGALKAAGITLTEEVAADKAAAFDKAAKDDQAIGVKVDATGSSGVQYKVVRAKEKNDGKAFRNYTQFYVNVGAGKGGMYVKLKA